MTTGLVLTSISEIISLIKGTVKVVNGERLISLISKKRKTATDTYQNRSRKYNCSEKKRKKTEHKLMIKRGKKKTAESKSKSKGRSYSAPKPV